MKRRWTLFALLCVCLLCAFSSAQASQTEGLEVHFLRVDRNDGILIRCGGEDVFIDSGLYVYGEVSRDYMLSQGVDDLKYYIGTHAHGDHIGGASVILDAFDTGSVLVPHDRMKSAMLYYVKKASEKQAVNEANFVNVKPGDCFNVGGATLTCLGPVSVRKTSRAESEENNNSLVMMLTYGEVDILLTADATAESLYQIEEANPGCLQADVLKNPHHDGRTKLPLLNLIQPKYTIISTSDQKTPSCAFTNDLLSIGSVVYSTAAKHCGTVILTTDGKEIQFETEYQAESLTFWESAVEIYEGKHTTLRYTLRPSKRYNALTFTSDDPEIAKVDLNGIVTGVSAGTTTIRARDASGVEAACLVTVNPATMTLRETALTVKQGSRVSATWKIEPSGSKAVIQWASEDEDIATVDEKGRIRGVYPGVTRITATMPSGQISTITVTVNPIKVTSVSVSPSSVSMTLGDQKTLKAKISPSNATWPEVTWSSADESIVKINADGTLTAVGVGKTTVTATTIEGKSRSIKVTVKPVYVKKITLKADVTSGLLGGVTGRNQVNLSYAVEPLNATIQDVTWSTSNKKIATVDANGVVTGHMEGTVTITCKATDGSGRYAKIKLKFGKNEMNRTVRADRGELLTQASRLRYRSNQLEIRITCSNRTGKQQPVGLDGWLTLITPDGEQIPLKPVMEKARYLSNGSARVYTYQIPVSAYPGLAGLDLSKCDAIIISSQAR